MMIYIYKGWEVPSGCARCLFNHITTVNENLMGFLLIKDQIPSAMNAFIFFFSW